MFSFKRRTASTSGYSYNPFSLKKAVINALGNFKAADPQNILENQVFQNIFSNLYNSC